MVIAFAPTETLRHRRKQPAAKGARQTARRPWWQLFRASGAPRIVGQPGLEAVVQLELALRRSAARTDPGL